MSVEFLLTSLVIVATPTRRPEEAEAIGLGRNEPAARPMPS